jgi:hypothetical protein
MQTANLPLIIQNSSITGSMDFEYFYQLIKIKLSLNVNETNYLFETIITPEQIFIKSIYPIEGIENAAFSKKWYQKKYLFNGNIINPFGFKTLEELTTESITIIEHFNNHQENWMEKLNDIKYSNKNCLHISVNVLNEYKKQQHGK